MAKVIKYQFLSCEVDGKKIFFEKELFCNNEEDFAASLPIAQEEAFNGEYTVEGDFAPAADASDQEERIKELEEALELILNGVTE